jgi:excisionase family DNA binding protein
MATKVTQEPSPTIEPGEVYTYEEAARLLKLSRRQVRRYVEDGYLGYVQLRRGRRIRGQQLLDYIDANTVEPDEG